MLPWTVMQLKTSEVSQQNQRPLEGEVLNFKKGHMEKGLYADIT